MAEIPGEYFGTLFDQIVKRAVAEADKQKGAILAEIEKLRAERATLLDQISNAEDHLKRVSDADSKMSQQYLRIKEKLWRYLFGETDQPFSQQRVDRAEAVLDEKIAAKQEQA